jgi:hypothetical protein
METPDQQMVVKEYFNQKLYNLYYLIINLTAITICQNIDCL